jgi:outer membrane protein assembly factor BamB
MTHRPFGWLVAATCLLPLALALGAGAAPSGHLKITTRPPGAKVAIDSEARGETPITVRDLLPGDHLLEIDLAGHLPLERVVEVKAGKTLSLRFILEKAEVGKFRLKSPAGSRVYVDGLYAGRAPGPFWAKVGKHKVKIVTPGTEPVFGDVEVEAGKVAVLAPDYNLYLTVEVVPPEAQIRVDGKEVGRGKVRLAASRGPHEVEAAASRHEALRETVVVEPGGKNHVRLELPRSRRIWSTRVGATGVAPLVTHGLALFRAMREVTALDLETGEVRWRYTSPAGSPNGMVVHGDLLYLGYGTEKEGGLAALKVQSGEEAWRAVTDGGIQGAPAILPRPPLVAAASLHGKIYAFDLASGKVQWEFKDPKHGLPHATPTVAGDYLYFTTDKGWALGLNRLGKPLWEFRTGNQPSPPPAAVKPTALLRGAWGTAETSQVYGLEWRTGSRQWSFRLASKAVHPVVLAGDLALFDEGTKLVALRLFGGVKAYEVNLEAPFTIPVISGGMALVSAGNVLKALETKTGKILWEARADEALCRPFATAKAIYAAAGQEVLAFDPGTGNKLWSYRAPGPVCELAATEALVLLPVGESAYCLDAAADAPSKG